MMRKYFLRYSLGLGLGLGLGLRLHAPLLCVCVGVSVGVGVGVGVGVAPYMMVRRLIRTVNGMAVMILPQRVSAA